jgi:hypothetical protein
MPYSSAAFRRKAFLFSIMFHFKRQIKTAVQNHLQCDNDASHSLLTSALDNIGVSLLCLLSCLSRPEQSVGDYILFWQTILKVLKNTQHCNGIFCSNLL